MFARVSRCLLRVSAGFPGLLSESTCCVSLSASSSLCTPLTAGLSTRSFSTSSTRLAATGLFHPCDVRLRRSAFKPLSGDAASPQQPAVRLHGTVTGFKHRRGYGFVLAEGVVPGTSRPLYRALNSTGAEAEEDPAGSAAAAAADALHQTYFFTRQSLGGGFFVTEGERVSFAVQTVDPSVGTRRHLGAQPLPPLPTASSAGDIAEEFSLDAEEAGGAATQDAAAAATTTDTSLRQCAVKLRFYNLKTHAETAVTPITLHGKIVEWDEKAGRGVVAELDVDHVHHADAPRFPVAAEDLDLSASAHMFAGRYVRFCLGPANAPGGAEGEGEEGETGSAAAAAATINEDAPLVARRVVVDETAERRFGAGGRPLIPASADPATASDMMRFSGVVRDIRNGRFGFITDDLSGESIFFHSTNARADVQVNDAVSYLLREMTAGKHAGKKGCFDVRPAYPGEFAEKSGGAADGEEGGSKRPMVFSATAKSPSRAEAKKKPKPTSNGSEMDFESL